jgi:hypothetical protein
MITEFEGQRVAISSLPDEALLEVFNFYVDELRVCGEPDDKSDGWVGYAGTCVPKMANRCLFFTTSPQPAP